MPQTARRGGGGGSMRVADIALDRDHTLTLFCEADQTAKVDAMFAEVDRLREVAGQALEAWDQPSGINYVDFRPYMDAIRAAIAEKKA
jgi:hypothetical protein